MLTCAEFRNEIARGVFDKVARVVGGRAHNTKAGKALQKRPIPLERFALSVCRFR
jgi:hypothetical protein